MLSFPTYSDSSSRAKIDDLIRLMDRSLTNTQYIDGRRASRLLGTVLTAYRDAAGQPSLLAEDGFLKRAADEGALFPLTLSAAFDLVTNIEYLHGRVVNSKWIYCHRDGEPPRAYYSFLKQCPRCCLDKDLEPRLAGAQHKPTSHHIGEITTTVTALLLQLIAAANDEPFAVATITKQSHDVDAIGFRDDLLVLFEIKSSPMVTFPLSAALRAPLYAEGEDGREEYRQHALVDMRLDGVDLWLDLPHRDWRVPLGQLAGTAWPYDEAIAFFGKPGNFLRYLSAWLELYYAYSTPKTQRAGRDWFLAYLTNGWGDEIDSNKTKPGLGRTDDIKKGTYQLLKFGAYYRDDASRLQVRGALVANLDPLFLRAEYVDKLTDVRWASQSQFIEEGEEYRIRADLLRYLYDAIIAFNRPVLNDPLLRSLFDLESVAGALKAGRLDRFLEVWCAEGPDEVVGEVAAGELPLWS